MYPAAKNYYRDHDGFPSSLLHFQWCHQPGLRWWHTATDIPGFLQPWVMLGHGVLGRRFWKLTFVFDCKILSVFLLFLLWCYKSLEHLWVLFHTWIMPWETTFLMSLLILPSWIWERYSDFDFYQGNRLKSVWKISIHCARHHPTLIWQAQHITAPSSRMWLHQTHAQEDASN